jgi:hypothetical protein
MGNTSSDRRLVSPESLAAESGMSESMILKLCKDELPSYKIGRCRRIDRRDWEEFLARRRETGGR